MPATKKSAKKASAKPVGNPEAELASFLAKFTPEIAALTEAILAKMRTRYPMALELVYDNYNALAIGYAPIERTSSAIFSIAVYPQWVSLFFLQAKALPDPHKLLQGNGKQVGYIRLASPATLDEPAVRTLMLEAESRAAVLFDPKQKHRLIIKSISAKQRPRRPAETTPPTETIESAGKKKSAAKKKST